MVDLDLVLLSLLGVAALSAGLPLIRFLGQRWRQRAFIKTILSASPPRKERRLIVSFSTLPGRINRLEPTIQSLLKQTRPPDEIVIAIPPFSIREQREYIVPDYLKIIPTVKILHCDQDWGPATKFIPAIQAELLSGSRDTLVVVVDDDVHYPRNAIELLLHYFESYPNAALCFRGESVTRDLKWVSKPFIAGDHLREPVRVAIVNGCSSYLIQPRFFDERLWDYSSAPAAAFYMDDIWISGWLDRRGVKKFAIPAVARQWNLIRQMGTLSLNHVPNGRQHSNDEVVAYFRDTWNVFAESRSVHE